MKSSSYFIRGRAGSGQPEDRGIGFDRGKISRSIRKMCIPKITQRLKFLKF